MDQQMDGWTNRWTNGWMDGHEFLLLTFSNKVKETCSGNDCRRFSVSLWQANISSVTVSNELIGYCF